MDHILNENKFYKELPENPLNQTMNYINKELTDLNLNGHISDRLLRFLKIDNCTFKCTI